MTDRLDWPTLESRNWNESFTIPQHPKPNSLRARVSFYASNIELGKPLPCCYLRRDGPPRNFLTGYRVGSELYFATFAFNQSVDGVEPDDGIEIWRWDTEVIRVGLSKQQLIWTGYAWNSGAELWGEIDLRMQQTNGEFPFNSQIARRFPGSGSYEPYWRPGIQCFLDSTFWQPSELPNDGPPGYPWPPSFDAWWTDQF